MFWATSRFATSSSNRCWRLGSLPAMCARIFRASVVVFLAIVNFSSVGVNEWIGGKSVFAGDGSFDVGRRHSGFLRQTVDDDGNRLSMEKEKQPVIDRAKMYAQLMDAIAQIVGFPAAQFVTVESQTAEGSPAFVVGFRMSLI